MVHLRTRKFASEIYWPLVDSPIGKCITINNNYFVSNRCFKIGKYLFMTRDLPIFSFSPLTLIWDWVISDISHSSTDFFFMCKIVEIGEVSIVSTIRSLKSFWDIGQKHKASKSTQISNLSKTQKSLINSLNSFWSSNEIKEQLFQ